MRLESPDAVYFRWRELRGELEAAAPPLASRYEMRAAVRPSARCPSCGQDAVTYRQDRPTPPREREEGELVAPFEARCAGCGKPWPLDLVPLLELPARGPLERRLAELADLTAILRRCTDHERRVYLCLYLEEHIGSFEAVADEASRRWPRLKPPAQGSGPRAGKWSTTTVRTVVLQGRQRILDGMIRAGLWRFS